MAVKGWTEHADEATELPVPGRYYVVGGIKKGEGLSHMAAVAYGDGTRWREIWRANKSVARKVKDDLGNWVYDPNRCFWPGDIAWIPGDAPIDDKVEALREPVSEYLVDADKNGMILIIDGQDVAVSSGQVVATFDTAADGFKARVPFNPVIAQQRRLYQPYGYQAAECYVGGKLMVRGTIYNVSPTIKADGRSLDLEGWSLTADVIDSTIKPPLERNKVTLRARAEELVTPLGVEVDFLVDDDKPFDRVTATEGQTILDHLADLAKQRGVQVSSSSQGRLLFQRAITSEPVCTLFEGFPPFIEASASYSGRDRFRVYTARGQSPGKTVSMATAEDMAVPSQRFLSFQADEADGNDMQKAANWRRSRQLGESLKLEIPTNSWYDPNGNLWRVGTMVTVISETLFLIDGFDFFIRQVDYDLAENGATAKLYLVPPQVYTGEPIPDPWFESPED
jgi:prophage tail gpP-like protein